MENIALYVKPGVHVPSDFKGLTRLEAKSLTENEIKIKLRDWLNKKEKPNVLMKSRSDLENIYPFSERLHMNDGLYKEICKIQLMNFAGNFFVNPEIADFNQAPREGADTISKAIEKIVLDKKTQTALDLILTEPTDANLCDIKTKIANQRARTEAGIVYSAWDGIFRMLTEKEVYAEMYEKRNFLIKAINISIPFAIFHVKFTDEYDEYSHVKVDLYSVQLGNEDERRSFVIWKKDDFYNYNFFVGNFNSIEGNRNLCKNPSIKELKEWSRKWQLME